MSLKRSIVAAGLAAVAAVAALVLHSSTSTLSPIPVLFADSLNCNLSQYKAAQGLTAAIDQDMLVVSWAGQNGADLRAQYGIDNAQPVIRDLAVKKRRPCCNRTGRWVPSARPLRFGAPTRRSTRRRAA